MSLRLHFAVRSDIGHVREGNEDSAYAGVRLLAVADGMGGHAAGEVASSTVISRLAELDGYVEPASLLEELSEAVRDANRRLRDMAIENSALDGMGTTVTAMLSSGDHLGLLHVGDSRAYLLRDGELSQITHDHTLVQDLVDQGRITPEQANTHPQRSLLMRALDGREVDPDLSIRQAVAGDRYLLCTDGLSGVVSEETILEALLLPEPQDAVDRLVELALKGGGPDNITVVVADVLDDTLEDDSPLVAGAAAEKRVVPGAAAARSGPNPRNADGESAAAKAARIGRTGFHRRGSDDGGDEADEDPERALASGGGRRRLFVSTVVLVLVVAGAAAGWTYVRGQYYVGVDDDRVAVFQGLKGSIVGISLSTVRSHHQPLSEVSAPFQEELRHGIAADDLDDAEKIVSELARPASAEDDGNSAVKPSPSPTATPETKNAGPNPSPTVVLTCPSAVTQALASCPSLAVPTSP
ncbi:serine/threonine protein phosphatase [Frankia sp. CcI49]|uniref:PP2C family protein-serine/threonine phosphatase n=1 Tax=unclassified Frankia TaxID=2632575 RepID=UPI0006CA07B7|nr:MULTISPECIES: PP2C family serine/threonine-protein phosphatase [unclassified Frankia]KPM52943.1 serine/threonine protein phosphatase [Frankia sp. R43]ONH58547.1 serine/threonine protein phosphatase [Frankia sp. CcI49]